MLIKKLRTTGFRNLADDVIFFHDGFNVLFGNNGQGKTSILEAISILGNLQSFRAKKLREVIRFQNSSSDIHGKFNVGSIDTDIQIRIDTQGRRVLRDGKHVKRAEEIIGCFPVSSFSPDDLGLIKGGADVRRKFLDKGCALLYKNYLENYRNFHKALRSRNHIIKYRYSIDEELLCSFEKIMAVSGIAISRIRESFVQILSESVNNEFLSNKTYRDIDIKYQSGMGPEVGTVEKEYEQILFDKRATDIQRGFTTSGPHRDDIIIKIDGHPAREYASQGQQRIITIALLLILVKETKSSKEMPVLLLDDISSELDKKSREELFRGLYQLGGQIILTTTDPILIDGLGIPARYFKIENGRCEMIS